jgi:hypothetical protein
MGERDVHIVVCEFSPIFYSQPDDGPPRNGPKHVVDFFNNLKIVVLRRTFIHLISISTESHNRDDAAKSIQNNDVKSQRGHNVEWSDQYD